MFIQRAFLLKIIIFNDKLYVSILIVNLKLEESL